MAKVDRHRAESARAHAEAHFTEAEAMLKLVEMRARAAHEEKTRHVDVLEVINEGLVRDLSRLKEALLGKMEAESDSKIAEAQKKIADAIEAANRATRSRRQDAIIKATSEIAKAITAKTREEVNAIRTDTKTRRLQAIAQARIRLIEAISRLRQEGGDVFIDLDNDLKTGSEKQPEKTVNTEEDFERSEV